MYFVNQLSLDQDNQEPPADRRERLKKIVAKRIVQLLREKNMTQSDLARASGLGKDSISLYVRGKTLPGPRHIERIAHGFQMTPERLLPNVPKGVIRAHRPASELTVDPVPGSSVLCNVELRRRMTYAQLAGLTELLDSFDASSSA